MNELYNQREHKLTLLKKFINENKHLAPQGSVDWLKMRESIIGGSELSILIDKNPFSNISDLVASKCGLIPFNGNIATNWGNIFEEISRIIVHMVLLKNKPLEEPCIFETGSVEGKIPNHRFSPDGLTVILTHTAALIALLEFKSPLSSIPSNLIPPYYLPQVKAGLCNIDLTEIGLFVNNMYRKSTIHQFGNNREYNTVFHSSDLKKNINVDDPLAIGIIAFYQTPDQFKKYYEHIGQYNTESSDEDTDESDTLYSDDLILKGGLDVGELTVEDTLKIFKAVSSKHITVKYFPPNIYPSRFKFPSELIVEENDIISYESFEKNPSKFIKTIKKKCKKNNYHYVGVLPWKLFKSDFILVEKDPLYIYKFVEKINHVIDQIKYIMASDSYDKKIDRFLELYPNKKI